MYHKVKIKKLPNKAVGGGINGNRIVNNQLLNWGGADFNMAPKKPKVTNTISGVPREDANLEAEGGETVYGDVNGDGMAEHLTIKGPRHSSGGVPLNLPDNTFIFSDTKSMKIKDPNILAKFGKSKGSYTPADLAKQYDLSKYRKILQDPESSVVDKKTAELMIRNYNMKLGALALAQESKKGFPQGIPEVARPYMMANGIKDEDLIPQLAQQGAQVNQEETGESPEMQGQAEEQMEAPMQMPNGEPIAMPVGQYGMQFNYDSMPFSAGYTYPEMDDYDNSYSMFAYGGSLPKAQEGLTQKQLEWINKQNKIGFGPGKKDVIFLPKKGDADYEEYAKFIGEKPATVATTGTTAKTTAASTTSKLSKEEEDYVKKHWNGKTEEYIKFKKTVNAIKSNPDFANKLYEKYKNVIANEANYTGGKKSNWEGALKDRKPEEVVNALLAQEERNRRLEAYGLDAKGSDQNVSKGSRINKQAKELIEKNKEALGDLDFTRGHVSQAAYIAYDDLINGDKPKGYGKSQTGKGDELKGRPTISGIDNYNTNTTLGQFLNYDIDEKTPPKTTPCEPCDDGTIPTRTADGKCPCGEIDRGDDGSDFNVKAAPTVNQAEWMTPDLVNYYGAIKDKSMLRKFMPWAPTPDLETPTPVYLDPTRELAAQSEQANIATQMLGQFAGSPQAASARLSSVQGQGASQAANTLANINNQNVGIANQFAASNANINNQEQGLRQQAAQRLYDQNTLANQQYLNSKIAADQNVRKAFGTGWQNASNLALTNAMYDQYDIDPRTGTVVFQGGKDLDPQRAKTFDSYVQYYLEQDFDPKDAINAAKTAMGQTPSILDGYGEDGGMYVMGSNVFPPFFY